MSMKACARAIGAELRAATPTDRAEWKAIIKDLARMLRRAFRRLPGPLLVNVGGGALELIVKAKAGWNVEKMLAKARQSDPDVDQIVGELQAEIEHESRAEEERARVELGPSHPTFTDPRRSPGPGDAPAAAPPKGAAGGGGPTLAPGITRTRH